MINRQNIKVLPQFAAVGGGFQGLNGLAVRAPTSDKGILVGISWSLIAARIPFSLYFGHVAPIVVVFYILEHAIVLP